MVLPFFTGSPISVGKLGGVEASHVYRAILGDVTVRPMLHVNAGIYCSTMDSYVDWCMRYIEAVRDLDYVLQWCPEQGDEAVIAAVKEKGTILSEFSDLEPFSHGAEGWHYSLADKRVLVISPLGETIRTQVPRYGEIWPGACIGNVEVVSVGMPEAVTGKHEDSLDWRLKMEVLKAQIAELGFDFAVVGAGGFSLEICQFIKCMGKSCIHLGGATQLLFGIRGKRWDGSFADQAWYGSNHWVRPLPHEVPQFSHLVENGCYW